MTAVLSLMSLQGLASAADNRVTPAAAMKAAQQYLSTYAPAHRPAWIGASVADPMLYETPSGQPDAYVVTVKGKGGSQDLGYIVVGASKSQSPIIESSTAPVPHRRLPAATAVAESQGFDKAKVRFVHGGPGLFVAEFKAGTQQPFLVNLGNLGATDKRLMMEPGKGSAEGINLAAQQWQSLSEPTPTGDVGAMAASSRQLVDFPLAFDMAYTASPNSGCGAIAGSAIYWWYAEYHGYEQLRDAIGSYDWADLADHLYDDMNSAIWGTSPTKWVDGMRTHANTHAGFNFTTQSVNSRASDYYSTFKSEINAGRPTGVYIGRNAVVSDDFEYHIMATYGYYHDTNLGIRQVDVATGWGYESSFDYDYYRANYEFSFMWVRPG